MGLLRLLTNPSVMGVATPSPAPNPGASQTACSNAKTSASSRNPTVSNPIGAISRPQAASAPTSGPTHTCLAAFARTTGFTLVTFDRGFSKHRDIPLKILTL